MWGAALDHVLEVGIVLANGTITRASKTLNPDIFFVGLLPLFSISVDNK
jgi:FAD/FMN-containing dehydrogenase